MKPSEITISTYIAIDGQLWPIQIKAEVEAEDYKALLRHTTDMISKLKSAGFKLFAASPPSPAVGPTVRTTPGKTSSAFAWPAPMCPACLREMRISKFQDDETTISYHCTVKLPMGSYCNRGATVDNKSGSVDYWETKK